MIHVSTFSGIGGFDLPSEWMGWQNGASCEINPFGHAVLSHYWPNAYHHKNIFSLTGTILENELKKQFGTDWRANGVVLTGGFPCQPFSLAGSRAGTEDHRFLWPEMRRVIEELGPDWIVLENVAGLFSILEPGSVDEVEIEAVGLFCEDEKSPISRIVEQVQRRVLGRIIEQILESGYVLPQAKDGTPVVFCLPACAVGAPHRRDRAWIIAHRKGAERELPRGAWTGGMDLQTFISKDLLPTITTNPGKRKLPRERELDICKRPEVREVDFSGSKTSTDTDSFIGCKGRMRTTERETTERHAGSRDTRTIERNAWHNFPTQPPVLRRNDGISSGLAGIAFPVTIGDKKYSESKFREECIKAFGNAIVPQVAFEIFQHIEAANKSFSLFDTREVSGAEK